MTIFFFIGLFAGSAVSLSPKFIDCQVQKPSGQSPLSGCPTGTILVSQDGTGHFTSVRDAVLSLEDDVEAVVLIAEGEYHETVNVTRSAPLTLLGQLPSSAIDSVNEPFANASRPNLVRIWDSKFVQAGMDDADTAVLTVAPSRDGALIGAGPTGAPLQSVFGNVDFKAYNVDFQNRAVGRPLYYY